jgi:hypothetical protein
MGWPEKARITRTKQGLRARINGEPGGDIAHPIHPPEVLNKARHLNKTQVFVLLSV